MEELLMKLEELFATEGEFVYNNDTLCDEVVSLCNENLITSHGTCNWSAIDVVRKYGYLVYPGDSDSFGWLTGVVEKRGDERLVVFG